MKENAVRVGRVTVAAAFPQGQEKAVLLAAVTQLEAHGYPCVSRPCISSRGIHSTGSHLQPPLCCLARSFSEGTRSPTTAREDEPLERIAGASCQRDVEERDYW